MSPASASGEDPGQDRPRDREVDGQRADVDVVGDRSAAERERLLEGAPGVLVEDGQATAEQAGDEAGLPL